jgi:uncharacterized protein YcnI
VVRIVRRATALAVAVGLVIVAWAAPAAAHVEVEADNPQAGATNVTVSFSAESESRSAGIVSLEVALPEGITVDQITLISGPSGWTLSASSLGYLVSGPVLPVGTDAAYKIRIAQLPSTAETLPFKTLQTYSDGRIDRWIDVPTAAVPDPDKPAPVLKLTGAVPAPPVTSAAVTPTAASTSAAATSTAAQSAATSESGSNAGWWLAAIVVLVLGVASAVWMVRRRRQSGQAS